MNDPKQALRPTTFSKKTASRVKLEDRTDSTNRVTNSTRRKPNRINGKRMARIPSASLRRPFAGEQTVSRREREVFRRKQVM
ncbi:hypothetical protein Acr_25g0010000 [Actinidia rufa]|uniref:Uncharacterized protein n=1 Tax=Actinidia rufa TaxID=165716 RepID=A0A7J0H0V7_9ERIC|nr:hypothetical protein Acr_25g0010000 [Actinidia rufa]